MGYEYVPDAGAFFNALGYDDIKVPDARRDARALAKYLNSVGGVGGRKVELVEFEYKSDEAQGSKEAALRDRECEYFTRDNPIHAFVSTDYDATLAPCLAQRKVLQLVSSSILPDRETILKQLAPTAYLPSTLDITSSTELSVRSLVRAGFLTKAHKIGLVRIDRPAHARAQASGTEPALKRAGLSLVDSVALPPSVDAGTAAAQNAVLRFRQKGIDTVIFLGLGTTTYFMIAAENQAYRPRYGLQTDLNPVGTALLVPHAQLTGSVGVGWQPVNDVGARRYGKPINQQDALCRQLMRDAGEDTSSDSVMVYVSATCDAFFSLQYVQDQAGGTTDFARIRAAVDSATRAYTSPLTFRSNMKGRYVGATGYRLFSWKGQFFEYTSEIKQD